MEYSKNLLISLKASQGLTSDYKAAQLLNLSKQAVSQIKNGHHHFSDESLIKIAKIMNLSPIKVVSGKYTESENNIMRAFWLDILDKCETAESLEFAGIKANKVA